MSYPYQIKSLEEYHEAYQKSVSDPEGFWSEIAATFSWHKPWEKVLEWNFKEPKVQWFIGGKLNITSGSSPGHPGRPACYHMGAQ
jgi:acetyl-CoA synthetase